MAVIEGVGEVLGRLELAAESMAGPAAEATVAAVSDQAVELMRSLAPVATGALRGSITNSAESSDGSVARRIDVGVRYALFVEFGGLHGAAQPFLRPALHVVAEELPSVAGAVYRATVPGLL